MLIHKTMKMPTSCLSCWIVPTCEVWVKEKSKYKGYDDRLDECPLEEVKHGHWIEEPIEDEWGKLPSIWHCSECDNLELNNSPYCPNCGAKMDKRRKDENT